MPLNPGTRLGTYEVVALIGSGGMGEVYRARDPKLKRDVALKILPDIFTHDSDRLARFQREAEVLASLNHPHIAQIYGLEEADGGRALVLEFVDGPTLTDRIARGPMPIDEALPIARQIAQALEAAHERGIIHRDLKPANIKLTADGVVKVLDFGLAKALESAPVGVDVMQSPTITTPAMTAMGVILGTAAYMSPEQARGSAVDKRADLWAFGAVLYEMLTGTHLFEGATTSDTLAHVLTKEPDWTALPANTPAAIRRLLRRCLEKDRKTRFESAADARLEIEEALSNPLAAAGSTSAPAWRVRGPLIVAGMMTIAAVGLAVPAIRHMRERPTRSAAEMRVDIATPTTPASSASDFTMSPDGRRIVFRALDEGRPRLWLRSLDSTAVQPLTGTEDATRPFWSEDSLSIGFFADGRLKIKRLDAGRGAPVALANARSPRGGAWSGDSVIFSPSPGSPILSVPAKGGAAVAVTRLDSTRQTGHYAPRFLPDGRHFLYYAIGSPEASGVYVGDLKASAGRQLLNAGSAAVYSSGRLFFVREGTLLAQTFDVDRLAIVGNPFAVAEHVVGNVENPAISVAATGAVAFRAGADRDPRRVFQLVWFDRSGRAIGSVGGPERVFSGNPSLSPDGRRVALLRVMASGNGDIWMLETSRGVLSRVTFDPSNEIMPLWSPDGSRLVFGSDRRGTGVRDLYQKPAPGVGGSEEVLLTSPQEKVATDWSRDGRFLLYDSIDPQAGADIWALPLMGDRQPFRIVATNFDERNGQLSRDGRWLAYESNKSGRYEVYVQPFPGPGGDIQVSTAGGAQVRWAPGGKELFYIAMDERLMSVPIRTAQTGEVEAGMPASLFVTHVGGAVQEGNRSRPQYVVTPDGRFLLSTMSEQSTALPITLILNWKPSLEEPDGRRSSRFESAR